MRFGRANTHASPPSSPPTLNSPPSVCHLSIMTLWIVSQSVRLSHHVMESLTSQSLTQPTQIKWLLMNFKQVLSYSSTCALLQPYSPQPPLAAPSVGGLLLYPLLSFYSDRLKLPLSHTLKGVPASYSLALLLLFHSLILPVFLSLPLCTSLL